MSSTTMSRKFLTELSHPNLTSRTHLCSHSPQVWALECWDCSLYGRQPNSLLVLQGFFYASPNSKHSCWPEKKFCSYSVIHISQHFTSKPLVSATSVIEQFKHVMMKVILVDIFDYRPNQFCILSEPYLLGYNVERLHSPQENLLLQFYSFGYREAPVPSHFAFIVQYDWEYLGMFQHELLKGHIFQFLQPKFVFPGLYSLWKCKCIS